MTAPQISAVRFTSRLISVCATYAIPEKQAFSADAPPGAFAHQAPSCAANSAVFLGIGIDENTAIILDKEGHLEVFGDGTVTIVDGSEITYNEIAEVSDAEPFAVCGVQIHILKDGLSYDFFARKPLPPPDEFLLPDIE